jgi:hypothetical protein
MCVGVLFAAILQHLSVLGLPASAELHRQQLKAAFHKAAMQVRIPERFRAWPASVF